MKVRSLKDIERDIRKETEKANTAAQYDMYASSVDDMFRAALAVAVTVFHRRGRSKQYIKKFAEDFMFVLECPPIFGKQLSSTRGPAGTGSLRPLRHGGCTTLIFRKSKSIVKVNTNFTTDTMSGRKGYE